MRSYIQHKRRLWLAALAIVLIGTGGIAWSVRSQGAHPPVPGSAPAKGASHAKQLSEAFRAAAGEVLPSVVAIETTSEVAARDPDRSRRRMANPFEGSPFGDLFGDNPSLRKFFDEMPDSPRGLPRTGLGSGVIIDGSGVILTNNHVVAGGNSSVMVRLYDGREFKAKEVKTDPKTDLAVVRIEGASNLKAAPLGDSDLMETGDWVLALGQPFGLESTVTAGIISAKQRGLGIADRESFLQTDAAINPGNSGGPLVNLDGEVIGINTAISSRSGGNQGIGFAVPINLAKWVSRQLAETGVVKRAYLGVGIQPMTQQLAEQFKVRPREGVIVTDVQPNTPAAKAGLQPGDVVVSFADKIVSSPQDLQNLVEASPIGKPQPLVVVRDGERQTLKLAPDEQPADYGVRKRTLKEPAAPKSAEFDKLGLEVGPLDGETAAQLGIKGAEGVLITAVESGSLAENAGLESGMVVSQVNRKPVRSVEDFRAAVNAESVKKGVLLLVRTEAGTRFIVLRSS